MEFDESTSDEFVELLKMKNAVPHSEETNRQRKNQSSNFEMALQKAIKLPRPQAYEVWRTLQRLINKESLGGQSAAVVALAMEFDPFPVTWEVLANKAFEHEHLHKNR